MDRSVIQNVMLERILSGKNKLSDFYDVFSYDIIADDVSKVLSDQKDHLFNISLLDIIIVGNFLVKEKKLTPSQISEFVLHINGEVGNGFKSPEYLDAIDELSSLLKCETNTLNKKIKAFKRRDKAAEELEHLANKRQQLIDAQEEKTIVMCRIKGTIDELQFIKKKLNVEVKHANKRDLLFKKHLKMAGLYEEQEKQIDPVLKQLLDELNSYAVLIEAGELPLKELTLFIYKLDCLDIKDNSLKNAVKDILSELKSRLNQMDEESKKNKKHIKTLVKREIEIKNYRYIDLKEFGEIITLRNSLKANVSILEELKKQSTYSSANLKRQIRRDVMDAIGANINSATNGMQRIIDQKQFYDESIDGKEYIHGLSTYNEMQDLMLIRENELENYVTSNKVKEVFLLENAYGFARSDKYAFSIEEVGNEIKLGIHIQNIQPYLSEKMYTFLYNELFKKLSDDMLPNNYVNDVC